MLLSEVEGYVRQDLFDPSAARWQTSDIDRAIDKAVDRYTAYAPYIAFTDYQMQPYQRTYPYPQTANPACPVLWIERILYPLQVYGSQYLPPTAAPTLATVAGTGLGIGTYQYLVTFLTQGGETTVGPAASITTASGNQRVALSNIPIAPSQPMQSGVTITTVIGRNVYRTLAGGSTFFYLASLPDNTTTTYNDTAADSVLTGKPQPPTVNTSGVVVWPPYERSFSEHSDIYDSSSALAPGGSGLTGTQPPSFTLNILAAELPKSNLLVMRVFYATKHQLNASGSTIPEVHRDVIVLGACAYAMEAYQVPQNDNFVFQDGAVHDRVNDSMIPTSWRNTAQYKIQQFEERLIEIKQQRDFVSSARAHWGDIPNSLESLVDAADVRRS